MDYIVRAFNLRILSQKGDFCILDLIILSGPVGWVVLRSHLRVP